MGVHGLWRLIDSAGKPIPVETLENNILAVDVSIWLHQLEKGRSEGVLPGLFRRIAKLLFFRIKPVFVFDGGVPALKRKTIAARQNKRSKASKAGEKARMMILENLVKHHVLGQALGAVSPRKVPPVPAAASAEDSLFYLPPLPPSREPESSHSSSEESEEEKTYGDLHSIDVTSPDFMALPPDMRHGILTELNLTRKQNSWGTIHQMPQEVGDFSRFQMLRLLKRRSVQVGLSEAEKEMGGRTFTLGQVKTLMEEQGVDLSQRIAADNTTRYIFASGDSEKNKKGPAAVTKKFEKVIQEEEEEEVVCLTDEEDEPSGSAEAEKLCVREEISQEELYALIKEESEWRVDTTTGPGATEEPKPGPSTAPDPVVAYPTDYDWGCLVPRRRVGGVEDRRAAWTVGGLPDDNELVKEDTSEKEDMKEDTSEKEDVKEDTSEKEDMKEDMTKDSTETTPESKKKAEPPVPTVIEVNPVPEEAEPLEVSNGEVHLAVPSEKEASATVMSEESESNEEDFLEVGSDGGFEIVVDPNRELAESEDIFADIFSTYGGETPVGNRKVEEKRLGDKTESAAEGDKEKSAFEEEGRRTGLAEREDSANTDTDTLVKKKPLTKEDLIEMQEKLEKETGELVQQRRKEERLASTMTEQLILEAQELLQLFGVPYVVAPMEAEAQCAYMERTHQTQGTISDDSDIFLFGATNVYKNFFNQNKFVLQFKASDIERCYKLRREDLILLALLTGSDYTDGLTGVGPVTALEILASYPPSGEDPAPQERLVRFARALLSRKLPHTLSHKLRSTSVSHGFPSGDVVKAYLEPTVDEETSRFTWALPDLAALRTYTRDKFGWDVNRTDASLLPIMERLAKNTTQRTLHGYFDFAFQGVESEMSGRVGRAVEALRSGGYLAPESSGGSPPGAVPGRSPGAGSGRGPGMGRGRGRGAGRARGARPPLKRPLTTASPNLSQESSSSSAGEDDGVSPPVKKPALTELRVSGTAKISNKPPTQQRGRNVLTASAKEARERAAKIMAQVKEDKIKKESDKQNAKKKAS